jgi:hypothetical protein
VSRDAHLFGINSGRVAPHPNTKINQMGKDTPSKFAAARATQLGTHERYFFVSSMGQLDALYVRTLLLVKPYAFSAAVGS